MKSVEAQTIEFHQSGKTYDEITAQLRAGCHRIARVIRIYL
jgi:hypothetical protein